MEEDVTSEKMEGNISRWLENLDLHSTIFEDLLDVMFADISSLLTDEERREALVPMEEDGPDTSGKL